MHDKQLTRIAPLEREWLNKLAKQIWYTPAGGFGLTWQGPLLMEGHSIVRSFKQTGEGAHRTQSELSAVTKLIRNHGLLCQMLRRDVSYNLVVAVYDHPGEPGLPPEPIFAFADRHLPSAEGKWPNATYAWQCLSNSFTHTVENKHLLAMYGFPAPMVRAAYE